MTGKHVNERNINIDIIRITALLLVISVHFFLWNGFYDMEMNSMAAFVMCLLRTVSMSCVPLFLLISGYLLSERDFFPVRFDYFKKLGYLLFIYFICTGILVFFRGVFLHEEMNIWDIVKNFFSFSQYSWYVAMYSGLYILIPYLNLFWKNLKGNDNREKIFLFVMIILATLPSVINIKVKIIPESWIGIYPVTYYFTGAFIKRKEKDLQKNRLTIFVIWLILVFVSGIFNYLVSEKKSFVTGVWNEFGALQNVTISALLFMFMLGIKISDLSGKLPAKIIKKVSDLSYIAFMLSYISDIVVWKIYKDIIPVENKLAIYVPAVLLSFVLTMFMSWIVDTGIQIIMKIFKKNWQPPHKRL